MTYDGKKVSPTSDEGDYDLNHCLECPVCFNVLDGSHKVLPCQHTFCYSCLQSLYSNHLINHEQRVDTRSDDTQSEDHPPVMSVLLLCPECRSPCFDGLAQLPCNIILNRILALKTPIKDSKMAAPKVGNTDTLIISNDGDNSERDIKTTEPNDEECGLLQQKTQFGYSSKACNLYKAMYDYIPERLDEICLHINEIYKVIEICDDGWFRGFLTKKSREKRFLPDYLTCKFCTNRSNNHSGVFPGNFVSKLDKELSNDLVKLMKETIEDVDDTTCLTKPSPISHHDIDKSSGVGSSSVLAASLKVDENANLDWFLESRETSNDEDKSSEQVLNLDKPIASATEQKPSLCFPVRIAPPPTPRRPSKSTTLSQCSSKMSDLYKCITSYPAESGLELTLKTDDLVKQTDVCEDGLWCKGYKVDKYNDYLKSSFIGFYPASFVKPICITNL